MPLVQQAEETKLSAKGSIRIERGIYRVDYPSHRGYRAYLKCKDKVYQKVFSLGVGEAEALAQARQWRAEKLREIQDTPEASNPLKKLMKNNTSGIIGVRRGKTPWGPTWNATWVENGRQIHRSFAINRFGETEAFQLACQARADAERRMYGKVFQTALEKSNDE